MSKIGFIGAGNMGGALVTAVCRAGYADSTLLCDALAGKAAALAKACGCAAADTATVVAECDYLFLGVKPQYLPSLAREIAPALAARPQPPVLISMAAGVALATLRALFGAEPPIVRIMPNTPVSVGEGMILYCTDGVSDEARAFFLDIMKEAGVLDEIPEGMIDAASAVSGCGPAFVYMFIEALADGGVHAGLPRERALRYAEQTVLGAAKLALESGAHPGSLKDAVCSPAGSTIEGVRTLEAGGFRSLAVEAVTASYERTKELGKA